MHPKASEMVHFATLNYEKGVSEGYFTQSGSTLLYASQTELLRINQTSIVEIKDYETHANFMYPYFYADNNLFAALEVGGVFKYTFDPKENSITKKAFLELPNMEDIKI